MENTIQRKLWESPVEERETVTHYFDKTTVDLMADFIHETRKKLPLTKRKKLNRSLLINMAMFEILKENSKFGADSFLSRLIEEWKKN